MSCLVDVAVPVLTVKPLTYEAHEELPAGLRVIVEVKKTLRCGFVLGRTRKELPANIRVKPIAGLIDDECVIDSDIWDAALWAGRVAMCGVNAALRAVLPKQVIEGEAVPIPPPLEGTSTAITERNCFNPFDDERVNFYLSELQKPERTLILFPTKEKARAFHKLAPEALLWPDKNIFPAWLKAHMKQCRIVIGTAGAVFAPLRPQRIIIDSEASPSYILPLMPALSARSIAGHRAVTLGAELITAGTLPSLKTYIRTKPTPPEFPERRNIILADIYHSRREQEHGIDGTIPLTFSLIRHTYRELAQGRNVLWILGRLGESSEVFCNHCGHSLRCDRCGAVMRAIQGGELLRCRVCGSLHELPEKCPECGGKFFMGKRPGLEALAEIVSKYYSGVKLYVEGARKSDMKGLILSTQRGLELCECVNPSLVAWLDLDLELWRPEYTTRYNVYSMLYESYYRGRKRNSPRKILIQARKDGMKLARFLAEGWGKFIPDELRTRREFMLPPYGYVVEVDTGSKIPRGKIIALLEDAGVFVMDPGDDNLPLSMNVQSLEPVIKILEPLNNSLKITVRSE